MRIAFYTVATLMYWLAALFVLGIVNTFAVYGKNSPQNLIENVRLSNLIYLSWLAISIPIYVGALLLCRKAAALWFTKKSIKPSSIFYISAERRPKYILLSVIYWYSSLTLVSLLSMLHGECMMSLEEGKQQCIAASQTVQAVGTALSFVGYGFMIWRLRRIHDRLKATA